MSNDLIAAILCVTGTPKGTAVPAEARGAVEAAVADDWAELLPTFRQHRIAPLPWHALATHGLTESAPEPERSAMQQEQRDTLMRTMALFNGWGQALDALAAAGVRPISWKGVVLASCYYPAISLRPMDDIDLAISGDELDRTKEAFKSIGYSLGATTADAVYFQNDAGIAFDVHHRVRLFEAYDAGDITKDLPCPALGDRTIRILSGEAMIAHLTSHARGHLSELGYLLRWIVDFHYVLQREWNNIVPARLLDFMPDARDRRLLGRVLGFLHHYVRTPLPPGVRLGGPKLRLEEVLRSHRLAMWGLPRPRGWGRVLAGRKMTSRGESRPRLKGSDYVAWPGDLWRNFR